jgi:hypothetical protein
LGSTLSLSCGRFFTQLRDTLRSIRSSTREPPSNAPNERRSKQSALLRNRQALRVWSQLSIRRRHSSRYRCRGCGEKGEQDLLSADAIPQSGHPMAAMLCASCRRVVEQLREDGRITAVFICNLGRKTRYFALSRNPASVWLTLLPPLNRTIIDTYS